MDTLSAFARGEAARGNRVRVFDWDKAAEVIVSRHAQDAGAGLTGDWEWTGGRILAEGKPVPKDDTYTYLASTWATPELTIDDDTPEPCWRYIDESPGWDSGTYWPDSALAILNGTEPRSAEPQS